MPHKYCRRPCRLGRGSVGHSQFFANTEKTNPWPVKRANQAPTALRASSSRIVFIVTAELSCILYPACECTPKVPRAAGNASYHNLQDRSNDRLSCSVVRWMAQPASSRSNLFAEWSLNKAKTSPPSTNSCPCRSVSAGLSLSCKAGTCDARRSSVRGRGGLSPGLLEPKDSSTSTAFRYIWT